MHHYQALPVFRTDAPWCVDGRPDPQTAKGPQMLGGSIHPIVLRAVFTQSAFDENFVRDSFEQLRTEGFAIGVHRGSHKHPAENKSDCGFADNLPIIFQKISQQRSEIIDRLMKFYQTNESSFQQGGIEQDTFRTALDHVCSQFDSYDTNNLKITGDQNIHIAEEMQGQIVNLAGDHGELVAFWNMESDVTYDTNAQAAVGKQAFNLDYWVVSPQARVIGVHDDMFTLAASALLYLATEMVLVEDRGKPALPLVLHGE